MVRKEDELFKTTIFRNYIKSHTVNVKSRGRKDELTNFNKIK